MQKELSCILIICIVLLTACKKEEEIPNYCNDTAYAGANGNLVAVFLFQPGTYWDYVNEIDSTIEHISVTGINMHEYYSYTIKPGPEVLPCTREYDFIQMNLSNGGRYQLSQNNITINSPGGFGSHAINVFAGDHFGGTYMDSLVLPTGTYFDVYKFRNRQEGELEELNSYSYFNSDFGIVRKEIYNPLDSTTSIWNLAGAHIIR